MRCFKNRQFPRNWPSNVAMTSSLFISPCKIAGQLSSCSVGQLQQLTHLSCCIRQLRRSVKSCQIQQLRLSPCFFPPIFRKKQLIFLRKSFYFFFKKAFYTAMNSKWSIHNVFWLYMKAWNQLIFCTVKDGSLPPPPAAGEVRRLSGSPIVVI